MKLKQDNLIINILKKGTNLYIKDKYYGSISLNDDELIINGDNANTNFLFAKMYINYLFKNKLAESIKYNDKTYTIDNFYFMNKYDVILFDIDDTILSFEKAERNSLRPVLVKIGADSSDETISLYASINAKYWKKVERKEISRDECLILRFVEFLKTINVDVSAEYVEDLYRDNLNKAAYVIPNARYVLSKLQNKYELYAITNGVKHTQEVRTKKAKVDYFFKKFYISEDLGYSKPAKEFLDIVRNDINNFDNKKVLIVGDSLTSDMALGFNNGIDTCWYNPKFKVNDTNIKPTYQINSILELLY